MAATNTPTYVDPSIGINLDRVAFDMGNPQITTIHHQLKPATETYEGRTIADGNSYALDWSKGLKAKSLLTALGLVLGNLVINIPKEEKEIAPALQDSTGALKRDMDNIGVRTQTNMIKNICETVDWHFEHRFFTKDAHGVEQFNWGALLIPFQFVSTEGCHVNGTIKLHVDAQFAPTFSEIGTTSRRAVELREVLKTHIQKVLQDQLMVYGIPGTTNSLGVYNKNTNILTIAPNGTVDISLPVSQTMFANITKTGSASSESAVGANALGKSIRGSNPENEVLAKNRLALMNPIFDEALRKVGISSAALQNARSYSLEANLNQSQVDTMADVIKAAFPGQYNNVLTGDDVIMDFVEKANAKDPVVMQKLQADKSLSELYNKLFVEKRSMSLSFDIDQNQKATTIHPISIALPLFLLWLIPGIRKTRKPDKTIRTIVSVTPAEYRLEEIRKYRPIARRIFDSNQMVPEDIRIKKENLSFDRLFDEYEGIFMPGFSRTIDDYGEKHKQAYFLNIPKDKHLMLQHFLSDEVGPDMTGDDELKEPLIDYMSVIMNNLNRYRSERNKELTVDDMIRKMSWDLVNMWQNHDEQANPMKVGPEPGQGDTMSLSDRLDYRHSPYVVAYARLLAEEFANIVSESEEADKGKITEETIRKVLELRTSYATGGYKDAQNNPIKGTSGNRTLGFVTTKLQAPGANTGAIL